MEEKRFFLYGRTIQEGDLALIRQTINQHWEKGRTFISQELCRIWNWRQPNGYPPEMSFVEACFFLFFVLGLLIFPHIFEPTTITVIGIALLVSLLQKLPSLPNLF